MPYLLSVADVEVVLRAVGDADPACRATAIEALSLLPLDADAARAGLERLPSDGAEFADAVPLLTARAASAPEPKPAEWTAPPAELAAGEALAAVLPDRLFDQAASAGSPDLRPLGALPLASAEALLAELVSRLVDLTLFDGPAVEWAATRTAAALRAIRRDGARLVYGSSWPGSATAYGLWHVPRPAEAAVGRALVQLRPALILSRGRPRLGSSDLTVRRAALRALTLVAPVLGEPPAELVPPKTAADDPYPMLVQLLRPWLPSIEEFTAAPQTKDPRVYAPSTIPPQTPVPPQRPSPGYPPLAKRKRWWRLGPRSKSTDAVAERTVYARLDAPEAVEVGTAFVVVVGVGPSAQPGLVSAPFAVPSAPFTLAVQVLAGGFRALSSGGLSQRLAVSAADPYPCALIRLVAQDAAELAADRAIQAVYTIDGQVIGVAARIVRVSPSIPALGATTRVGLASVASPAAEPLAPGFDWALPDSDAQPDLAVIVAPGNDAAGNRLAWSLWSPHPDLPLPSEPVAVTTRGTNADWARAMMRGVEDRLGAPDRAAYLRGVGYEIRDAMPPEFWAALRAVAARTAPRPPTLLLASWEPYIPWELATVDQPWDAAAPGVLGAQTVMGRWTYHEQHRTPAPPATLELATMAVVSAVYPGAYRLAEAEREATDLVANHGAVAVTALAGPVLDCLAGQPPADAVHFAVHGKLDASGTQDGLMMMDGRWLSPRSVRGVGRGPVRLAFLNACQVGQGQQALGEPAGMAAALVGIGAGAVVAPLWKVDDAVARTVAEGFYPAVWGGQSPGEYLRRRRGAAAQPPPTEVPGPASISTPADDRRTADNGAEIGLAYVYFGHPSLRVTWRGSSA